MIISEFKYFKKITLKRLRPILKSLDIQRDYLEMSTTFMGKGYQVRVHGILDDKGNPFWEITRVVNRSILPSVVVKEHLNVKKSR